MASDLAVNQSPNIKAPEDSAQQSLVQAIRARSNEYVQPRSIRIKVASWNVAALPGTDKDLGAWLVEGKGIAESLAGLKVESGSDKPDRDKETVEAQEKRANKHQSTVPLNDEEIITGGADIDLYALGLQEIVDVGSATEAFRPFNDANPPLRWKQAAQDALPAGFKLVAEQQLHGLFLLIFASPKIYPSISSVSCSNVGTGLMGYMGNKGAVTIRLVLGETTRLVFVNSHLAAGTEKANLERRNWDAGQIVSRTKYDAIDSDIVIDSQESEGIGAEDYAWWFGDLNYRLEGIPGDDVRRLLLLHTRNEYDIGDNQESKIEKELSRTKPMTTLEIGDGKHEIQKNQRDHPSVDDVSSMNPTSSSQSFERLDPEQDPMSVQTTLLSLLPHDQLRQQQKEGKCFHDGWREGPISFMPTYKYDVGSVGVFDTSEKKRAPSWCDRILYRSRKDKEAYEDQCKKIAAAQAKDQDMKARGVDQAAEDENVLFDYDPDADGVDESYNPDDHGSKEAAGEATGSAGDEDKLTLDIYTSHQRVISSDHKPLVAVFTLKYDAVVPSLKAAVHQDVVKAMDKLENEARAGVTVVVENENKDHQSPENVQFGAIRYGLPVKRSFTVANTSQTQAVFSIDQTPPQEGQPNLAWLSIEYDAAAEEHSAQNRAKSTSTSSKRILDPGDAMSVHLTALVSRTEDLRAFNSGEAILEEILVLHLLNGRDHFIPVHAEWMQSSFGRSIEELVRVPEGGIRRLQNESKGAIMSADAKWSAPRELFRLTGTIEDSLVRVIAEHDMTKSDTSPWLADFLWPFSSSSALHEFLDSSSENEAHVREALDTDQPLLSLLPDTTPAVEGLQLTSKALELFLLTIYDGVIDASLWSQIDQIILILEKQNKSHELTEEHRSLFSDLLSRSPSRNISFIFLTTMLSKIIVEIETSPLQKHTTVEERRSALAKHFAPLIIRAAEGIVREKEKRNRADRMQRFMLMFIGMENT